jgi:hypothetical protein
MRLIVVVWGAPGARAALGENIPIRPWRVMDVTRMVGVMQINVAVQLRRLA